jgi:hypothetical protein
MINVVSGAGRLVLGVSGSPGSVSALRYALPLAYRDRVPLVAVLARVAPGGDLSERRMPDYQLRGDVLVVGAARRRDRALDRALPDWDAAAQRSAATE